VPPLLAEEKPQAQGERRLRDGAGIHYPDAGQGDVADATAGRRRR
jgi:hypothetical protein